MRNQIFDTSVELRHRWSLRGEQTVDERCAVVEAVRDRLGRAPPPRLKRVLNFDLMGLGKSVSWSDAKKAVSDRCQR